VNRPMFILTVQERERLRDVANSVDATTAELLRRIVREHDRLMTHVSRLEEQGDVLRQPEPERCWKPVAAGRSKVASGPCLLPPEHVGPCSTIAPARTPPKENKS
jgi:hypothetical protein